jgi:hypothetical protein
MIKKEQLINKLKKCDDKQLVIFDPIIESKMSFLMNQIRMILTKCPNLTLIVIKNS